MSPSSHPAIIECEIRLHTGRPAGDAEPGSCSATDWNETAVGDPAVFQAVADPAAGAWVGPLAPGVDVSAPVSLDDPWWTVRLPRSSGVPMLCDRVGRALAEGEAFTLPAGEPGEWSSGIVFDGHVVTD